MATKKTMSSSIFNKKMIHHRSPLKHLNNGTTICSSSTSSSSSSSSVSSVSVVTHSSSSSSSSGSLRFFHSTHSSTTSSRFPANRNLELLLRTQRSVPSVHPSKNSKKLRDENVSKLGTPRKPGSSLAEKSKEKRNQVQLREPGSSLADKKSKKKKKKKKKGKRIQLREPGSKSGSKFDLAVFLKKSGCGSELSFLKKEKKDLACETCDSENVTPMARLGNGGSLDNGVVADEVSISDQVSTCDGGGDRTPPVEVSVSPELVQCEPSSAVLITPGVGYGHCHAAIYGTKSKKKCRPRGVLIVDDNSLSATSKLKMLALDECKTSLVPSPVEASLHWHSSCDDDDKGCAHEKDGIEGPCNNTTSASFKELEFGCSSPYSSRGFSSGSRNLSVGTDSGGSTKLFLNPCKSSRFRWSSSSSSSQSAEVTQLSKHMHDCISRHILAGETTTCLSSGRDNFIQAPQSEASSDDCVIMSPIDEHEIIQLQTECELDTVDDLWTHSSFSGSRLSTMEMVGTKFLPDYLNTSDDSVNMNEFQTATDSQSSSISGSVLADLLETELKISWKDDMIIHDRNMDDLDCCRCFSEEEEESEGLKRPYQLPHPSESADFELKINTKCEKSLTSNGSNDSAESMSWSRSSMLTSADSDSMLHYENLQS